MHQASLPNWTFYRMGKLVGVGNIREGMQYQEIGEGFLPLPSGSGESNEVM